MGYYNINDLKDKIGAELLNAYELKKGYRTDPCVEDQFWMVVDFAKNGDFSKKWWNFSNLRKAYRIKMGYPITRPKLNWTDIYYKNN